MSSQRQETRVEQQFKTLLEYVMPRVLANDPNLTDLQVSLECSKKVPFNSYLPFLDALSQNTYVSNVSIRFAEDHRSFVPLKQEDCHAVVSLLNNNYTIQELQLDLRTKSSFSMVRALAERGNNVHLHRLSIAGSIDVTDIDNMIDFLKKNEKPLDILDLHSLQKIDRFSIMETFATLVSKLKRLFESDCQLDSLLWSSALSSSIFQEALNAADVTVRSIGLPFDRGAFVAMKTLEATTCLEEIISISNQYLMERLPFMQNIHSVGITLPSCSAFEALFSSLEKHGNIKKVALNGCFCFGERGPTFSLSDFFRGMEDVSLCLRYTDLRMVRLRAMAKEVWKALDGNRSIQRLSILCVDIHDVKRSLIDKDTSLNPPFLPHLQSIDVATMHRNLVPFLYNLLRKNKNLTEILPKNWRHCNNLNQKYVRAIDFRLHLNEIRYFDLMRASETVPADQLLDVLARTRRVDVMYCIIHEMHGTLMSNFRSLSQVAEECHSLSSPLKRTFAEISK